MVLSTSAAGDGLICRSHFGRPTAHQVCTRHASKCEMSRCSVMPMTTTLKSDSYRMYACVWYGGRIEHPCQSGPSRLLPVTAKLLPISSGIFPRRVDYWSCSHVLYQSPPPADTDSVSGQYSGFTEGRFRK